MASLPDHLMPVPVGREKLPRDVIEEHQRDRALEAAIPRLAEQGYAGTTVDDLVAAARIGVGSFYSHFSGKEDCLLAAYEKIVGEVRATISTAVAGGSDWPTQVCLGLQSFLVWIAANPARAKILVIEIQAGGPIALARYQETLEQAAQLLRQGRGITGDERRQPEALEQTIVSGIAWLLNRDLALDESPSIPKLFEDLAELILEPYLGEERAAAAIVKNSLAPTA